MRALKSFFIFADSVPRFIRVELFRSIKSFQNDMRLASQFRRINLVRLNILHIDIVQKF